MKQGMFTVNEVIEFIQNGETLILAGDEKALQQLPQGKWIGGTTPYFMSASGGLFAQDQIHVTSIPEYVTNAETKTYDLDTIPNVYSEAPDHGFSIIILPAFSEIHSQFALKSPEYESFACSPLIGWISGIYLEEEALPKVFDGITGESHTDKAVVLKIGLRQNKVADIQIINLFQQGDGDTITFPEDGFGATEVSVNGETVSFATYLQDKDIDTKLPLVADMHGAMINTSFQNVDQGTGEVKFYAPVFSGIKYKLAQPVENYVDGFKELILSETQDNIYFSCNCILNYLYADLEGKSLNGINGPITFGEIAYQLLNQTMAYITIDEI